MPIRRTPTLLGLAFLTILALRGSNMLIFPTLAALLPVQVQALCLLAGISLLLIGIGGLRRAHLALLRDFLAVHRREALLFSAIVGLAFALRLYHVGDSVLAFIDEGPFMSALMQMRLDPTLSLTAIMHPVASSTRLFPFIQLLLSDVFGDSLAIFRLTPVLFGTLTVAATYGLARSLFDRRTAFIAGLIFATFPPHIHMSRIGIYNIADPLFGVLALLCFSLALRTRQRLYYVLAGIALGMLRYFYEGGELVFPALILLWVIWLFLTGPQRPSWSGLGWMLAMALLVALPVYFTNASYGLPFFTRLNARNLGSAYWEQFLLSANGLKQLFIYLGGHFLPPLLHYFHAPDASLFYGGQTALVLPFLVPFFLLGVVFALWRLRRGGMLLLLWLLVTVIGNSLIIYNNWTARFVVAMPAVALVVAVGLRYSLPLILKAPRWRLYKSLVVIFCLLQVLYYFGLHLPYYNHQIVDLRRHYDVVYRTMALPEDTRVYMVYEDYIQTYLTFDFLKYLGDQHEFVAVDMDNFDLSKLPHDQHYVFFANPNDKAVISKFEQVWYLDGPYYDSTDIPQFYQYGAYHVSPWLWRDRSN